MNLDELGWDSFFEEQFSPYHEKGLVPGRITSEEKTVFLIYCESGECKAKLSGKVRYNARSRSELPVVGDWVALSDSGKMIIQAVLPRKSKFSRKVASNLNLVTEEQVISANVDIVFIVSGMDADFNMNRILRYLTIVAESGACPVIILNKRDLCPNPEGLLEEVRTKAPDVPVYAISALKREGLEALPRYFSRGKTVTLLGSSGVGKSTLINRIISKERQAVGEVREDGKGRHITVKRELIFIPGGGLFIDNPGMRSVSLWGEKESVDETFEDIADLSRQCKFKDCTHRTEPGCAIKKALDEGTLDEERFKNFLKLKRELAVLSVKRSQRARMRVGG
jgi:ribosome biogenesis GTPase